MATPGSHTAHAAVREGTGHMGMAAVAGSALLFVLVAAATLKRRSVYRPEPPLREAGGSTNYGGTNNKAADTVDDVEFEYVYSTGTTTSDSAFDLDHDHDVADNMATTAAGRYVINSHC